MRPVRVHCQPVHAVPDLGVRVRDALGLQPPVDRPPALACVVGPERARGRDRGEHPAGRGRVEQDRVQAHPARARLPRWPGVMAAQRGQLLPVPAAVVGPEEPGVLDSGVHQIRIVRRWFQMPDPGELPRVRRPVVPLVRTWSAVVGEPVAHGLPGRPAVVGSLDDLARPAAGLRGVQPVRVGRGPFQVIDLPAGEVRPADLPPVPRAVRGQDERALARTRQYPYSPSCLLPPLGMVYHHPPTL